MQRQISDASPLGELLDNTRGVTGAVVATSEGELIAISGQPGNAEATAEAAAAVTGQLAQVGALLGLGDVEVASIKGASASRVVARQAGSIAAIELDAKRPLGELENRMRTLHWAKAVDRPESDRETTMPEDVRDVRVVTVPPQQQPRRPTTPDVAGALPLRGAPEAPPPARPSPPPAARATPMPSSVFRQPSRPSPSVPLPPPLRPTPSVPVPPPVASDLMASNAPPPRPRSQSATASGSRPLPLPLAPPPAEPEVRPTPFPAAPSRPAGDVNANTANTAIRPSPLLHAPRATPPSQPSQPGPARQSGPMSVPGRAAASSPGIPAQMRPTGSGPVFSGDLEEFGLPDLLQLLRNSSRTGLLVCTTNKGIGTVQLSRGMIIGAASPHALDLRQHFLTSPEVGAELRQVLAALPPESFADDAIDGALVSRELMPRDEVERARVARIFSAFREMIGWTAGRFSFDPAVPVSANPALALSAQTILMRIFQEQDDQGGE